MPHSFVPADLVLPYPIVRGKKSFMTTHCFLEPAFKGSADLALCTHLFFVARQRVFALTDTNGIYVMVLCFWMPFDFIKANMVCGSLFFWLHSGPKRSHKTC